MNRFAEAIQLSRVDVVPRIMVGGGSPGINSGGGGTGSIIKALMALLLSDKMGVNDSDTQVERSPDVEALRQQIRQSVQKGEGTERGTRKPTTR
jgi:hypothetical protein